VLRVAADSNIYISALVFGQSHPRMRRGREGRLRLEWRRPPVAVEAARQRAYRESRDFFKQLEPGT